MTGGLLGFPGFPGRSRAAIPPGRVRGTGPGRAARTRDAGRRR